MFSNIVETYQKPACNEMERRTKTHSMSVKVIFTVNCPILLSALTGNRRSSSVSQKRSPAEVCRTSVWTIPNALLLTISLRSTVSVTFWTFPLAIIGKKIGFTEFKFFRPQKIER